MKQNIKTIDYEWLTRPTGDPFADTGGFVIQYLWETRFPDKDIDELIDFVTKLYVNNWEGKLHTFFHGSKITNPSIKLTNDKIEGTLKFFKGLLYEEHPFIDGYCRITGRKTKLYQAGRESLILSGSGSLVNFHHFFQPGLYLSKEVMIRMFFIPLGTQLLLGKIAILQSSISEFVKYYVYENCKKNLAGIASLEAAIHRSEFNKPSNALFEFIQNLIEEKREIIENEISTNLTLYHASNFGASTELNLYQIPATVFSFYTHCLKINYKQDWLHFVRSHYTSSKNKGARYNPETEIIEVEKKGEIKEIGQNDYKLWTNWIYNKLLAGDSIVPEFLRWSKKGNKINLDIIQIYQLNVRKMKKETIKKILQLADFVIRDKNEHEIQKRIRKLNGAKSSFMLRRFFVNDIVVKNHNEGNKEPIISVDDFTNYLFPDGSGWQEIRDVLLIAIYQKLHELNMKVEVPAEEEIEENEVEPTNN